MLHIKKANNTIIFHDYFLKKLGGRKRGNGEKIKKRVVLQFKKGNIKNSVGLYFVVPKEKKSYRLISAKKGNYYLL